MVKLKNGISQLQNSLEKGEDYCSTAINCLHLEWQLVLQKRDDRSLQNDFRYCDAAAAGDYDF